MSFYPSINNLTGEKPQGYKPLNKNIGREVRIGTTTPKTAALKKKAYPKQYGDKGYKPSTGMGVGH